MTDIKIIRLTLPFYVFVRCVLQETTVRTSVSLNGCMQRQKWSRQPTAVGASRQISPSRKCVLTWMQHGSLLEQMSCSSITRMGGFIQCNLQKVAFMVSETTWNVCLYPLGWVCDRICGWGDRCRRVPAANQTGPWKPHDQLLHAHSHKGNLATSNHHWKKRCPPNFL